MSYINTLGYVVCCKGGKEVYEHRAVWEAANGRIPDGMVIDHIDGNPTNNALGNLRVGTQGQNTQNRRRAQRNNKSTGLLGASYHPASGRFHSRIMVGGKSKSLGYFDTAEQAHLTYLTAKRELHEFCSI